VQKLKIFVIVSLLMVSMLSECTTTKVDPSTKELSYNEVDVGGGSAGLLSAVDNS